MILKQGEEIIRSATRKKNLFVFDTSPSLKTMSCKVEADPHIYSVPTRKSDFGIVNSVTPAMQE